MVCCHENLKLPFFPSAAMVAGAALMLVVKVADFVLDDKGRVRVTMGAARRIRKAAWMYGVGRLLCVRNRSSFLSMLRKS